MKSKVILRTFRSYHL